MRELYKIIFHNPLAEAMLSILSDSETRINSKRGEEILGNPLLMSKVEEAVRSHKTKVNIESLHDNNQKDSIENIIVDI